MTTYRDEKKEVLEGARWLAENGFFGGKLGSGGNISVMLREKNALVITPSGIPYSRMTQDNICVVAPDLTPVNGKQRPSMESGMHAGIYKHRPDVNAVVHSHQVFASIFALTGRPIPALFDEVALEIGPEVEIVPYAVSGSTELVKNVVSRLGNGGFCYILRNHGALSLGVDLEAAMRNAELLEKVAQVYYYALCTGDEISTLPETAVEELQRWRALKR